MRQINYKNNLETVIEKHPTLQSQKIVQAFKYFDTLERLTLKDQHQHFLDFLEKQEELIRLENDAWITNSRIAELRKEVKELGDKPLNNTNPGIVFNQIQKMNKEELMMLISVGSQVVRDLADKELTKRAKKTVEEDGLGTTTVNLTDVGRDRSSMKTDEHLLELNKTQEGVSNYLNGIWNSK